MGVRGFLTHAAAAALAAVTLQLIASAATPGSERPRLAVLGDSISTGAQAVNRAQNGYGVRLGHLLEAEYETRVFARSSLCLLRKADLPYAETEEFQSALEWAPDVALVLLGTNDTIDAPRPNWRHAGDLKADTRWLVQQLRDRNPDVVVHLLEPPPFLPDQAKDPNRAAALREREPRRVVIAQALRRVAASTPRVLSHDLSRAVRTTTDGVHPDTFGHERLARELQQRVVLAFDESYDTANELEAAEIDVETDRWHGFPRHRFRVGDAACQLVAPHQTAAGRPWIWRARFFGHEPALDLSLLDRGFHLAYCDVANLYGSRGAQQRWDCFYRLLHEDLGLAEKAVLEGMSRGGLPVLLWASHNPEKVAAIYADNPVANSLSWPGGQNGKRSDADWQRLLHAFGVDEDTADQLPQPLDRDVLLPLAEHNVPIALVFGRDDQVTPAAANALPLARRYAELGGPVQLWPKPGAGHHPHGLDPPAPLRRLLLRACGLAVNPATRPTPSSEYRAGAGWGSDWHAAFAHARRVVAENAGSRVVLLGDSITQGLTGHQDRVARPSGTRPIDRWLGEYAALSLGLSGDRTEHVLWRLRHGQLDGLSPQHIVLMIGVNNINAGHTGDETADGTAAIVAWLRENQPDANVLLLGCFPTGAAADDPRRAEVDRLHKRVAELADGKRIRYLDLREKFLRPGGSLNQHMRSDAVHISGSGAAVWMEALATALSAR